MTSPSFLWTADELARAIPGAEIDAPQGFDGISGIAIDSRSVVAGDLFVARKGPAFDGHDFITDAFTRGAAAALVRRDWPRLRKEEGAAWPLLRVEDPEAALIALAQAARERSQATVVAVTGSAGKTGTKEMLAAALGALGPVHASQKSYNNHIGVPLTLATLPAHSSFAVVEMGMNHKGEIAHLTAQARPHIAVITTVEAAHIENLGSLEAIADAKAEIFTGLVPHGTTPSAAVLNIDNPLYRRLAQAAREIPGIEVLSFGEDEQAETCLTDCSLRADGSKITARMRDGRTVRLHLRIPGKHIATNALAVLTVVDLVASATAGGGTNSFDRAVAALEKAQAVNGRGQRHLVELVPDAPPLIIIDESYNANPGSMRAALETFAMTTPPAGGRRIAVLGDMLELGRDGPQMHADLANPLLHARVDLLFCCGPLMEALYQTLPPDWRGAHAASSLALVDPLLAALRPGDVVLVKGSLGSKMAYIVEALQNLDTARARQGGVHAL